MHLLSGAEAGKRGDHTGNQHTNGNINNINISKKQTTAIGGKSGKTIVNINNINIDKGQQTAMGTSTAFTMRYCLRVDTIKALTLSKPVVTTGKHFTNYCTISKTVLN